MTTEFEIYVIPKRPVLDDKGCVWESLLANAGWNDLPENKKSGRVIGGFSDGTFDIHFEALNHTCRSVFPDELCLIGGREPDAK